MIRKLWYIYTMNYYSTIKRNKFESVLMRWKNLLLLLLSCFSHVRLCATQIDSSPPGSSVPGILQARTLEWVAISFSNA